MSPAWSTYIVVIVLLNILAVCWLLWWTRRHPGEHSGTTTETTGHVWDGDLQEYNNPLPRWWLWLFILTVVFGLIYLCLYPGLGNYAGALHWSSAGQHEQEQQLSAAEVERQLAPYARLSVAQLRARPEALAIGRNLFADHCIACHGADAHGAPGFPNLTDSDWLWGGTPEAIETTITQGRTGVMIGWHAVLGSDAALEDVLAYVLSLSGRKTAAGDVTNGKAFFMTNCVACHGADGKGNQIVGAPNLTDQVWLHGGSIKTIRDVIANGRTGQMPAWAGTLDAERIRLLSAYVLSLHDAQSEARSDGQ
ncbi:MAG: cytochrome-c oxidase, cbb3-type subunit III [Steroidobacteraceae bacterium]